MRQVHSAPSLILASASPRRKELLAVLGIPFETIVPNIPEDEILHTFEVNDQYPTCYEKARAAAVFLAQKKAAAILSGRPDTVVIGADTLVATQEEILGKPSSPENAAEMLIGLSGKDHMVFTGVSITGMGTSCNFCSEATVTFFPADNIQHSIIRNYTASGIPMDKAGAYGIQDYGALLISNLSGDYYTVVGLPIARICRELKAFGYSPGPFHYPDAATPTEHIRTSSRINFASVPKKEKT